LDKVGWGDGLNWVGLIWACFPPFGPVVFYFSFSFTGKCMCFKGKRTHFTNKLGVASPHALSPRRPSGGASPCLTALKTLTLTILLL